jgi:hypothetical protein
MVLVPHIRASTIVAVLQNLPIGPGARIVLAADGVEGHIDALGRRLPSTKICKIPTTRDFLYSVGGVESADDGTFNAYRDLAPILSKQEPFEDQVTEVQQTLLANITRINPAVPNPITQLIIIDSAHFPHYYLGEVLRTQFGYVFAKGGAFGMQYSIPTNTRVIPMAIRDHISVPGAYPAEWLINPVEGARKLVQIEADKHPGEVGPPFAIVDVTSAGVKWVEPGVCKP